MPNKDYLPTKDTELQAWTKNFLTVANDNLVPLGLVAGDVTPVSNFSLPWFFAGTTTKATFEHTGHIPGKMLFYRDEAQRNELLSEPSNVTVVYAVGVAVPLSV